jgi:XTP/dITP diphosphohydrolase
LKIILFASSNRAKFIEAQNILKDIKLLYSPDFSVLLPKETGMTFDENAILKSQSGFQQTGIPTLSEDSGLVIDALYGAPGIHSARYAGGDIENIQKVLKEMKNAKNRHAKYVCVAAFSNITGTHTFRGEFEGEIASEPIGEGGFGYDPIFIFDGVHTTAQISLLEKNAISHRSKALKAFIDWFLSRV